MRGPGQIAELCAIAAPDVAVITNVGPVHVELLGSVEAIAAAKAEIHRRPAPGWDGGGSAASKPLEPYLGAGLRTCCASGPEETWRRRA
jgi:hypothetical protein